MDNLSQPPQLRLDAPNLAAEWTAWLEDWELYSTGSGLHEKPAATQRAVFLHCIGSEARIKFKGFTLSDADRLDLSKIKEAFAAYCTPTVNEVIERYHFWHLTPGANETIDAFVSTLRAKAKGCNFGDQEEKMIRDRIVFTCPDKRTKEALIRADKLDLMNAVRICRAAESARDSMRELGASSSSAASVAAVSRMPADQRRESRNDRRDYTRPRQPPPGACGNCGTVHEPRQCPAYGKECGKCHNKGHFAKWCRGGRRRSRSRPTGGRSSVAAHAVDADNNTGDDVFHIGELVTINAVSPFCTAYRELDVNGTAIPCKIDTGAQVNAMPLKSFNRITDKPTLRPTTILVKPYGLRQPLKPAGVATLSLAYRGRRLDADFLVIDTPDPTLLGLDACLRLGIVHIDAVDVSSSTSALIEQYSDIFTGVGCVPGEYHISVDKSVPPVIHASRKIPLNLRLKVQQQLNDMERLGIIIKRTEPTEWVNSLLIIEKKNHTLRLCLDPRQLNQAIRREHFQIPTFDDVIAELHGKKMFTVIDMRDGFWHIKLDEASSRLCTFNTPFGRYSFQRLAFGISSAPEVFQRKNFELFGDIPNVHIVFDDIIIAAADDAEHDAALRELFDRARRFNVRFNKDKLRIKLPSVRYLGHVLSADGVKPDPDKVRAINDMPTPTDKKSLQRFIGMVQFLGRWLPHLADMKRPLCQLLRDDVEWAWSTQQDNAVRDIKAALVSAPVLRFFDPSKPAVIQCDASSTGIGAVLNQEDQPCAFASRALTEAETRYAQIEKELLAIVFSAEKFEHFIYGKRTVIQSDHRPLQTIFQKPISKTTPRLQRMLIRIARFDLEIVYRPGKHMHVSDALSRAYLPFEPTDRDFEMAR
jgi:hypothetical protein